MTEDVGEFHFCMEKALMDQVGAVFIDYDPTGSFRIYTERPLSIFTTGGGFKGSGRMTPLSVSNSAVPA